KPVTTERDTKRISEPSLRYPAMICSTPHSRVAASRYSRPWFFTRVAISSAMAPVAAEIIPGRPPAKAITTAIQKEAYKPTFGSTPARMENAMASGINANATTRPESRSPRTLKNQVCLIVCNISRSDISRGSRRPQTLSQTRDLRSAQRPASARRAANSLHANYRSGIIGRMPTKPPYEPVDPLPADAAPARFGRLIGTLARKWRRAVDQSFREIGLTDATRAPLIALHDSSAPMRQKDLAEILSLEKSSLVRGLSQLRDMGLVEWCVDPDDRRAKSIQLCAQGRELARQVLARSLEVERKLLEGL